MASGAARVMHKHFKNILGSPSGPVPFVPSSRLEIISSISLVSI